MAPKPLSKQELTDRFWNSMKKMPNDCWEWQKCRQKSRMGYGLAYAHRKQKLAHRFAYELTYGPIPPGMCVMHKCDNPPCCNPAHLTIGTIADNNHDMKNKGRNKYTIQNKLTPDQVKEIRASSDGAKELALRYDISRDTIYAIRRGDSWKHI